MNDRRERLLRARLYLVCDAQPNERVGAALKGGADIVQVRIKDGPDGAILAAAARLKPVCARYGALLILNDRADLVEPAGADGVHVGQDDMPVRDARAAVGPDRLVGLSTHTPEQVDAASDADLDYIGVGPVHETPTKPGRPAVGLELVRYAATHATVPFFAIGGISPANVEAVRAAGAQRVAVVRAIVGSADPELSARRLRNALTDADRLQEAGVGPT